MEFSFKLSQDDMTSYLKVANRRRLTKPGLKLFFAIVIASGILGFAMAAYMKMYSKYPTVAYDLDVILASASAGGLFLVAIFAYEHWLYQTHAMLPTGALLSAQIVDANAQTITFKNSFGTFTYSWHSFLDRAEDEDRIYLFADNAIGLVIPKGAIATSEQLVKIRGWAQVQERANSALVFDPFPPLG